MQLAIDEVPFSNELHVIESVFREFHKNIRMVTIGPAGRQPSHRQGNVILLSEPSSQDVVLSVLKQAEVGLPEERLGQIASKSAQDLRFALRLLDAFKADPSAAASIIGGPMPLLDHILSKTGINSQEQGQLTTLFDAASCFLDIGVFGDVKTEIDSVKEFFGLNDIWLGRAISQAREFGLSTNSKNYFEATPRGLADMVFAKRSWKNISHKLDEFFALLPDRLQRKFLERCQDCTDEIREEVAALLGGYFLSALRGKNILILEEPSSAKKFSAWATFDPKRALNWLAKTVDQTPIEVLTKFHGHGGYGESRGRRHIVWLCESLARFPELFELCEKVLFRLAVAENEPQIGNNATFVWRNLFWPTLSQSATPFDDRARLLLHRLRTSEGTERRISIECGFEVMQHKTTGMAIPPQFVGGRLAPQPWRATSVHELMQLRKRFAKNLLDIRDGLTDDEKLHFDKSLVHNLLPFVWLDMVEELQNALGGLISEDLSVPLRPCFEIA